MSLVELSKCIAGLLVIRRPFNIVALHIFEAGSWYFLADVWHTVHAVPPVALATEYREAVDGTESAKGQGITLATGSKERDYSALLESEDKLERVACLRLPFPPGKQGTVVPVLRPSS